MNTADRRAAIAAYKEIKPAAGVFAVHCRPDATVWVGTCPNLEVFENRLWFTLRLGSDPNAGLQKAWTTYGETALGVEILEQLDDDISDISRPRILKERQTYWMKKLGASKL